MHQHGKNCPGTSFFMQSKQLDIFQSERGSSIYLFIDFIYVVNPKAKVEIMQDLEVIFTKC